MGETFMNRATDFDPVNIQIVIHEQPAKLIGEATMTPDMLQQQAEFARDSLAPIDYTTTAGTCGDERERVGLRSGAEIVKPRPSVWGGPETYGLYISEMAGVFSDDGMSAGDRLAAVAETNKAKSIPAGGHEHCAAAGSFGTVLENIVANRELAHMYAQRNMEDYDATLMDEAIDNAARAVESGRYRGWNGEQALSETLGDDANEAIERLADVPHEGRTFVRVKIEGYTVDQTGLHNRSGGEDSFVQDDPYADRIETAHAGSNNEKKRVMEHAREALTVGVALAVPNTEIHQIDLR